RHTRFSRDWSSDVCSSDLGDFKKADLEKFADEIGHGRGRERFDHAAHPRVAHRAVHGDVRVAHAQARVAVPLHIFLRSAEPTHQIGRASCKEMPYSSEGYD